MLSIARGNHSLTLYQTLPSLPPHTLTQSTPPPLSLLHSFANLSFPPLSLTVAPEHRYTILFLPSSKSKVIDFVASRKKFLICHQNCVPITKKLITLCNLFEQNVLSLINFSPLVTAVPRVCDTSSSTQRAFCSHAHSTSGCPWQPTTTPNSITVSGCHANGDRWEGRGCRGPGHAHFFTGSSNSCYSGTPSCWGIPRSTWSNSRPYASADGKSLSEVRKMVNSVFCCRVIRCFVCLGEPGSSAEPACATTNAGVYVTHTFIYSKQTLVKGTQHNVNLFAVYSSSISIHLSS